MRLLSRPCGACGTDTAFRASFGEISVAVCGDCWVASGKLDRTVEEDRDDLPEYDSCEDCLGSGGYRDPYGEGTCNACGGSGKYPANEAARVEVRNREMARQEDAYERARRQYEEEYYRR